MKKTLLIPFAVATCLATQAPAATLDFVPDFGASSVSITNAADGLVCSWTKCGITATLAAGFGTGFSLGAGQSNTFDFLTFTGTGTGGAIYDVSATLGFSSPALSVTTGGTGAALLFSGYIVGGYLNWTSTPDSLTLADGSEISIDFGDGLGLFLGSSVTTTATVAVESVGAVAPVPLPASALLLLAGLGGLAAARRRKVAR